MSETSAQAVTAVLQGTTPYQIIQLFILGVIAVVGIVWLVKWIIDLKIGKLPEQITEMSKLIASLSMQVTKIEGKLWSHEEIQNAIKAEINAHAANCPCRNKSNK